MATEENSEQKFELDLSDDSLKAVQVTETTPAALVSETVARRRIVYVAREFGMTNIEAFAALAIICQKGGTAKGAQGSVYAIINGKKVELTAIRRLMREHGFNYT
jgi:predicted DNA-binding transcriptional regulator